MILESKAWDIWRSKFHAAIVGYDQHISLRLVTSHGYYSASTTGEGVGGYDPRFIIESDFVGDF